MYELLISDSEAPVNQDVYGKEAAPFNLDFV